MSIYTNKKNMLKKALVSLAVILLCTTSNIFSQNTSLTELKTNDADGSPVSLNGVFNAAGVVTAVQQLGTGAAGPGAIQDGATGIAVYGNAFTQSGVKIGDSVVVSNFQLKFYNGLTELSYTTASTVTIVSSGHTIAPTVVTIPEIKNQQWNGFEKYESMLLQINNVHFVDSGTFDIGTSSGHNFPVVSGTDTLDFRIVKTNTSLIGKAIPTGTVNVVGILSQYISTAPYSSGYQLLPLDSSGIMTATAVETSKDKNYSYGLYQNYPNPFNPSTVISFEVPTSQQVELSVYNLLGQKVASLYNQVAPAGVTNVNFKANNLTSGVYVYTIKTGNMTMSKKLMLLK